ncbi:MAG TPA: 3-dehydroquinate synthase [bacterium]|nr:3-dehydroquinate synthase [bacterium]
MPANVILIGFMGTGKTAIGQVVAARLGRPFVDTDALIEARAGRPIPRIFAEDGEEAFRTLEAQVVAEAADRSGAVIATGGGVVLSPANMDRLRRTGIVIALRADPQAILARVGRGGDRPLLGDDPEDRIRRLLDERSTLYAQADFIVETSALPLEAAAERVLAFVVAAEASPRPAAGASADGSPQVVHVELGARGYDVCIGRGILADAAAYLGRVALGGRLVLLTHPRIDALYGRSLAEALRQAGRDVVTVIVPPSETSKSLRVATRVFGALVDARCDRRSVLLALGGGVAGDLGGFVAATFLRGIPWVSLPTTLLAQVDASLGGKTGINFRAKNLIGAVHQPALVLSDIETLRSLPLRELRSGMAEVVKTGVIGAPDLFEYVSGRIPAWRRRDPDMFAWIVARCATYKAGVVAGDELEAGPRMVLNYGHTIGHGIEAAASYRGLTHGEAIAVGMTLEARIAVRMGLCDEELLDRQTRLLEALGLPVRLRTLCRGGAPAGRAVQAAMGHDKKAAEGRLRFVLPQALGRTAIREDVSPALVAEVLADD